VLFFLIAYIFRIERPLTSLSCKSCAVNIIKNCFNSDKTISVHAGKRLRIPCTFSHDPLNRITNIEWTKNDAAIDIGPGDKIDFGMDGSITVNDVQRRHQGDYRCLVRTVEDNATDVVNIEVVVNAPVIVSHSPDEQIVFEGDTAKMMCRANGIPDPKVTWLFNRTRITSSKDKKRDSPVLSIDNVILSDSGKYVCTAINEYGQTRHEMALSVVPVPKMRREYVAKVGERMELPCATETDSKFANRKFPSIHK
jgi:hypothetical protein